MTLQFQWKPEAKVAGWRWDPRYQYARAEGGFELEAGPSHPQVGGYYWSVKCGPHRRTGWSRTPTAAKAAAETALSEMRDGNSVLPGASQME